MIPCTTLWNLWSYDLSIICGELKRHLFSDTAQTPRFMLIACTPWLLKTSNMS